MGIKIFFSFPQNQTTSPTLIHPRSLLFTGIQNRAADCAVVTTYGLLNLYFWFSDESPDYNQGHIRYQYFDVITVNDVIKKEKLGKWQNTATESTRNLA